jgi:flagellin-like protein
MKGISPLVAAVLLIGVTMTIAGALAFWVSGFMTERTKAFEKRTAEYEKCIGANFDISFSFYNNTDGTLVIYIENKADVRLNLTGISIMLQNGTVDTRELNKTLPRAGVWDKVEVTNVAPCEKFRILTECTEPPVFREGSC